MMQNVAICLPIVMALDFLTMYFIDSIMKIPGLMIILMVLGSVLLFVQVALAIQMMIVALTHLGVFSVV